MTKFPVNLSVGQCAWKWKYLRELWKYLCLSSIPAFTDWSGISLAKRRQCNQLPICELNVSVFLTPQYGGSLNQTLMDVRKEGNCFHDIFIEEGKYIQLKAGEIIKTFSEYSQLYFLSPRLPPPPPLCPHLNSDRVSNYSHAQGDSSVRNLKLKLGW